MKFEELINQFGDDLIKEAGPMEPIAGSPVAGGEDLATAPAVPAAESKPTKPTVEDLMNAWKEAGSPMDIPSLHNIIIQVGEKFFGARSDDRAGDNESAHREWEYAASQGLRAMRGKINKSQPGEPGDTPPVDPVGPDEGGSGPGGGATPPPPPGGATPPPPPGGATPPPPPGGGTGTGDLVTQVINAVRNKELEAKTIDLILQGKHTELRPDQNEQLKQDWQELQKWISEGGLKGKGPDKGPGDEPGKGSPDKGEDDGHMTEQKVADALQSLGINMSPEDFKAAIRASDPSSADVLLQWNLALGKGNPDDIGIVQTYLDIKDMNQVLTAAPDLDSHKNELGSPAEETGEEPAEETGEEAGEEPAEETGEEPAEETGEEPAEETGEEAGEEPAEETGEEPAEADPKLSKVAAELEAQGLTQDDITHAYKIANDIVKQGGSFGQVSGGDKMLLRKVKAVMKKRPGDRPTISGVRFGNKAANIILKASTMIEEEPLTENYNQYIDNKYTGR